MQYDRQGDAHYDAISALIKSIRGSDPDAALYWLARMLEGGEDVRFLARRLVILASEDVGNADPAGLPLAVAAAHACELVGLPECQLTLAQAVTYLACAPKSNAATVGIGEARADVREGRLLPVPVHLRDSHYAGAKRLGHGEGYQYAHDAPEGIAAQDYLGVEREYYRPTDRGFERELAERLAAIRARLREERRPCSRTVRRPESARSVSVAAKRIAPLCSLQRLDFAPAATCRRNRSTSCRIASRSCRNRSTRRQSAFDGGKQRARRRRRRSSRRRACAISPRSPPRRRLQNPHNNNRHHNSSQNPADT